MHGAGRAEEEGILDQPITIINVGGHYSIGSRRVLEAGSDGYEFLLIHSDGDGVVLLPYPDGTASEDAFRLTRLEERSAVFESPEHDFPKRIIYRLDADADLVARIDGGAGTDGREWRMRRIDCDAP